MKLLSLLFIFLLISGCDSPKPSPAFEDSVKSALAKFDSIKSAAIISFPEVNLDTINCGDLENPAVVYALAKEAQENEFPNFETLNFFTVRGHFSSTQNEQILIRIESHAGVSCGTCCNLVLLYSCEDKIQKIWSGYSGNFSKENIRDLNNDGLLEIESSCGFTWSCTLGDRQTIFNLANGKEHVLYESVSENYMDEACGDKMRDPYRNGDTISYFFHNKLIDKDQDGIYEVRRIRECTIYCGGKTEAEIEKRKRTDLDTIVIPLSGKMEK